MAAKIGILGESTVVTVSTTTTLYTVPTDKAARVKVFFIVEGGSSGTWYMTWIIGSPGGEGTIHGAVGSATDNYSGARISTADDPAGSILESDYGWMKIGGAVDMSNYSFGDRWLAVPLTPTYYLSEGDVVQFNISGIVAVDLLCQVIGVEDDA